MNQISPATSPARLRLGALAVAATSLVAGAGALATAPAGAATSPTARGCATAAHQDFEKALAYVKARQRVWAGSANFRCGGRLEALDSMPQGGATGRLRRVWFFYRGRAIDDDGAQESTLSSVRAVNADTVAVTYTLWREHDPMCCPTGGRAVVRYHLGAHGVKPLDRVPAYDGPVHR